MRGDLGGVLQGQGWRGNVSVSVGRVSRTGEEPVSWGRGGRHHTPGDGRGSGRGWAEHRPWAPVTSTRRATWRELGRGETFTGKDLVRAVTRDREVLYFVGVGAHPANTAYTFINNTDTPGF